MLSCSKDKNLLTKQLKHDFSEAIRGRKWRLKTTCVNMSHLVDSDRIEIEKKILKHILYEENVWVR